MIRKGTRVAVELNHKGCVKCGLSRFLNLDKQRADLELVSYLLKRDRNTYRILLIIRSLEEKEINNELEDQIWDFLFDHKNVRAFKRILPRAYIHQLSFLMLIEDLPDTPGSIRIVSHLAGWFNSTIGTRISEAIEHITFFVKDRSAVGRIIEEYARHPDAYEVQGVDFLQTYMKEADFINDPYYIISVLLDNIDKKETVLDELRENGKGLLDTINHYAWWLIPWLKEILRWVSRQDFPPWIEYLV